MNIGLSDVSDDHVDRLCRLLARRPEYGIAIPSGRWLRRQEEKLNLLPKELLRSTNPLKRWAMKLADRYDSEHVDPQAVFCSVHQELNPFLIRRLFLTLSYEVTVHTDSLRSWQGRVEIPEIAALVGRVDSITALWTMPELFYKIYGDTPFEGKHIFVRSRCEACILAAIGANGQCLADLRAVLIDRQERRVRNGRKPKTPRFTRFVESWIDQLKKKGDEKRDRAAECRARSEETLHILRQVRAEVMQWRAEQKAIHKEKRASKRPIYTELRKSSTGDKLAPLSNNYSHKRRTRNGIPVALTDPEHAVGQRQAAMAGARRQSKSIYRPDSLCDFSEVGQIRPYLPNGPRPNNPEPRMSRTTSGHESPTKSFIQRFEHEISLDLDPDPYDDGTTHVMDEIDDDEIEASRAKVENWYMHRLFEGNDNEATSPTDQKSVISMVHPAFRPDNSTVAPSAIPPPLRLSKDVPHNPAPSVWTDVTVKSPTSHEPQPPVPRVPSGYKEPPRKDSRHVEREPSPKGTQPLNWPAPPTGPPPPPQAQPRTKPNHRKYLFPESCADSTLSAHQRSYIRQKKRMRDYPPDVNPFTRSGSRAESESKLSVSRASGSRASGRVPSLSGSHGDTVGTNSSIRDGGRTPIQGAAYYPEANGRDVYGEENEGEQWDDIIPDESASNVHWRRPSAKTDGTAWPGM
ncbi:hypothetical protein GGR57DRAFT_136393 [Xylariaceae sp. FL1272]|nr:hypothetical protein GGR57DRAFT_136393 [Xylariaceae sp. FL1272]